VVNVLEHPDLIAAEVARQETTADDQRAEVAHELSALDAALTKLDREAQRWAEAYAAEVINVAELKGYRAEIDAKRQSLLAQHAASQARLDAIGQEVAQVGALIDYCARVRQRLQTFDSAEKRLAFRALDIRVTWTPGQPLTIEGSIPLTGIVPIAS
jgi:chromosome segregation ATPase